MRWTDRSALLLAILVGAGSGAMGAGAGPPGDGAGPEEGGADSLSSPELEASGEFLPENVARELAPRDQWVPFYIELRALGSRVVDARVEVRVRSLSRARPAWVVSRGLDISPGSAPRRVWLPVLYRARDEIATVEAAITSDGEPVRRLAGWRLDAAATGAAPSLRALVCGGGFAWKPLWGPRRRGQRSALGSMPPVERAAAHRLPDRVEGYQPFSLVVLRGIADSDLEPAQRDALLAWVEAGGHLVLAPVALDASIHRAALARELLGDAWREPASRPPLRPGFGLSTETARSSRGIPLSRRPVPGRSAWVRRERATSGDLGLPPGFSAPRFEVPAAPEALVRVLRAEPDLREEPDSRQEPTGAEGALELDGAILYGEVSRRHGRVGLLAVDDQFEGTSGTAELRRRIWEAILDPEESAPRSGAWGERSVDTVAPGLVSALRSPERDVGLGWIAGAVLAYLLVVGPGVFLWVRRRNRPTTILWLQPLVVVLSLAAILLAGFLTKGLLTKVRTVTVLSRLEGSPLLWRESWLSVFSSEEARFDVEATGGALLHPVFANAEEECPVHLELVGDEATPEGARFRLRRFPLAHWQQGVFVARRVTRSDRSVTLEAIPPPQRTRAVRAAGDDGVAERYRVTNGLDHDIERLEIRHGRVLCPLDRRVPRGATIEVRSADLLAALQAPPPRPTPAVGGTEGETTETLVSQLEPFATAPRGTLVLRAHLDRGEEDFRIDRPHRVVGRESVFLLYR